jgi:hypothetical protein
VACKYCGADDQKNFHTEVAIHLRDIDKPHMLVFPELLVCLKCGNAQIAEEFVVPEHELRLLPKRNDSPGVEVR